jgi:hypothetical protein
MKKWSYKTGDILKEVQFIYDRTIKCDLTCDCLVEVTTLTGVRLKLVSNFKQWLELLTKDL